MLDPFSGGGAIPLEAMRLGCDVTAADLNPVAWFVLKCTLEYPHKLLGQKRPLPDFILRDREFMESFLKEVKGLKGVKLRKTLEALGHRWREGEHQQDEWDFEQAAASAGVDLQADLAWQVRAWGRKVIHGVRKEQARLYPAYAEWQPLTSGKAFEPQPMRFVEPDENGVSNVDGWNAELGVAYLEDKFNPRWVIKPTVAYLWARTVRCKNCRATLPLLKTRWLCKKDNSRIRLLFEPNLAKTGVEFSIEHNVPERGGNAAQKREHDKKLGVGTMSRAGAQCPCCQAIMKMEDIRYEGKNGRMEEMPTAVVVDGLAGKEFRLPTDHEKAVCAVSDAELENAYKDIPFGLPQQLIQEDAKKNTWCVQYGVDQFSKLFTRRQLLTLSSLVRNTRNLWFENPKSDKIFVEAIEAYLTCGLSRLLDFCNCATQWKSDVPTINHSFARFALPLVWDYCEGNPIGELAGSYLMCLDRVCIGLDSFSSWSLDCPPPNIEIASATSPKLTRFDCIVTDPPYYDAIGYAVLMDYFYVWLRRMLSGVSTQFDAAFAGDLAPKWDNEKQDGELIDDASRHGGDKEASKKAYEDGMAKAFQACHASLADNGRFVIVFAHKHPDAWETLVSAIIRAGFVVDGSWPIQTEQESRMRAMASAALASSVWLVCRKRDPLAKVGWDNRVMAEMRENIAAQLREFWDAGIRGPDFVWAATGPAMEAYSKYPAVKKANSPTGEFLSVKEFLDAVRRIVIEFVVGRVLHIESGTDRLDSVTSYYLLHRNDFGFEKAPAGACILYAVSCGLSDAELERTWNLVKVKGSVVPEPEEAEEEATDENGEAPEEASGGEFILRTWKERKEKRMGFESVGGREIPLIDRVHRLMHLWHDGDVRKVDDYLDEYVLRQNELFKRLIQSLIELSEQASEERSLLESLSNHLGAKAPKADTTRSLGLDVET
jgi:adenine-specific DNA methylase